MSTDARFEDRPSREWLRRMAELEDRCESVTAGGLAHDLGMLEAALSEEPWLFGRFIQFARRARHLSVEKLAEQADIDIAEILGIECGANMKPAPRTVHKLAQTLGLSSGKLMELCGLAEPQDEGLRLAALRFAARSEPVTELSAAEREAFEEFVKVLSESPESI